MSFLETVKSFDSLPSKKIFSRDISLASSSIYQSSFDSVIGNVEQTGFGTLQSKILLNIFKYLTEDELVDSVIPVCQKWKYVASTPSLWKTLKLVGRKVPVRHACSKLRVLSSHLKYVYMKNVEECRTIIRHVCCCLGPNLCQITIRYCDDVPEKSLRNMVKTCYNLEKIDLKGTEFKSNKFYKELKMLKKLKSINLSNNKELTKQNVLTTILNCNSLEEIDISLYKCMENISEKEWGFLIRSVMDRLKSLCIDGSTLSNYTFHTILQCPYLEKFGFIGAYHLSSNVFLKLMDYPIKLTSMRLRYAHLIKGNDVKEVFSKEHMHNLEYLDLTGCWQLTTIAMEAISVCKKLRVLILRNCKRIGDISSILMSCKEIRMLNIAFCDLLNMERVNILLLPKLETLFIDEHDKYLNILKDVLEKNITITIKICLSEYNKATRIWKKPRLRVLDTLKEEF